jgi:hypothetical protein
MGAHLPFKGHDKNARSHEYMIVSLFNDWVRNTTTEASVSENFWGGTAETNDNAKLSW